MSITRSDASFSLSSQAAPMGGHEDVRTDRFQQMSIDDAASVAPKRRAALAAAPAAIAAGAGTLGRKAERLLGADTPAGRRGAMRAGVLGGIVSGALTAGVITLVAQKRQATNALALCQAGNTADTGATLPLQNYPDGVAPIGTTTYTGTFTAPVYPQPTGYTVVTRTATEEGFTRTPATVTYTEIQPVYPTGTAATASVDRTSLASALESIFTSVYPSGIGSVAGGTAVTGGNSAGSAGSAGSVEEHSPGTTSSLNNTAASVASANDAAVGRSLNDLD